MSDTYRMFQESGFAGDVGWHLVTQLVNHIFTDDMAKVRSFVYDAVHADQQKRQAISVLWGTFRTHSVMQEYLSYNIEHHPSIALEYVKFLVLNKGNGTNTEEMETRLNNKIADLEAKVTDASNLAKTTRDKHSTTINSLNQLKTKVGTIKQECYK